VRRAQERFEVSERRAFRALEQPRTTQRYKPKIRNDEDVLTDRIIELACEYGRDGCRGITAMLRLEGWEVVQDIEYNG
jgi:putative transposase